MRSMKPSDLIRSLCLALSLGLSLSAVQAGKPDWVEGGGHG